MPRSKDYKRLNVENDKNFAHCHVCKTGRKFIKTEDPKGFFLCIECHFRCKKLEPIHIIKEETWF